MKNSGMRKSLEFIGIIVGILAGIATILGLVVALLPHTSQNPTTGPSVIGTATPRPGSTVTSIVTRTPGTGTSSPTPGTGWNVLLKQQVPYCDNTSGVSWELSQGATYNCQASSLLLSTGASLQLKDINNTPINVTNFKVQVQFAYSGSHTEDFHLAINGDQNSDHFDLVAYPYAYQTGEWRLTDRLHTAALLSGSFTFNPNNTTLTIQLQKGVLYVFVNNQQSYAYNFSTSGNSSFNAISIYSGLYSSASDFLSVSKFELDAAST